MAAGRLILDLAGETLLEAESEIIQNPQVGGVIFFSRNFSSRDQITELCASIKSLRKDILLCVDQEGGRVQRFKAGFTRLPPMLALSDYAADRPELAHLVEDTGWLMAAELIACGIDFSFAPVLDVDRCHCEVIANRSFGDGAEAVIKHAGAFIDGMHQAGMAATGKHFPGHGGVVDDSHLATPYDQRSLEELLQKDIKPFAALAGKLEGIMPAHIIFPRIDEKAVGFSRFWLQEILRTRLNFQGVIFSDDLSMKGADVEGGYRDKAKAALTAGCDSVLVCNNRAGALEVLEYLAAERTPPSGRLAQMKAAQTWHWQALEKNPRWLQTRELLEHIPA